MGAGSLVMMMMTSHPSRINEIETLPARMICGLVMLSLKERRRTDRDTEARSSARMVAPGRRDRHSLLRTNTYRSRTSQLQIRSCSSNECAKEKNRFQPRYRRQSLGGEQSRNDRNLGVRRLREGSMSSSKL